MTATAFPHGSLAPPHQSALARMLHPASVALIGASEEPASVGRTIFENLLSSPFAGPIHPVNPAHATVLGRRAFARVSDIPGKVDLAVIATPAAVVPRVIHDCAGAGVAGAAIVSAGFRECGAAGRKIEDQVVACAKQAGMRLIGPNCLGLMLPHIGLNATFAAGMSHCGSVGFLSQSGALCTAVLDWSLREKVGFSAFFSMGSMADVGWGELIYWLGDDPLTQSIVIYMESIGDARTFLSAAREVALTKPIVILKVGRTEGAAKAAASHTGSLTGCDDVLDAAFRRAGVLRMNAIEDLFDMAEVLSRQPRPRGPRLAVLTNAGGPAALATDRLLMDGGSVASLSNETRTALNSLLPAHWSHSNPVDILGDADAARYASAAAALLEDSKNDGLLVILTPQAMTEPTATAHELERLARSTGKPILASWMGAGHVEEGKRSLNDSGIPTFAFPDAAAHAFATMCRYSRNLDDLYETPGRAEPGVRSQAYANAKRILDSALENGRTLLTEFESKQLLAAYGIPVVETKVAHTCREACDLANRLGHPVALKLHSKIITHKSAAGGVKLNLLGKAAVARAWKEIKHAVEPSSFQGVTVQPMIESEGCEIILGCSTDPQFGPVLLFGTGGRWVEAMKDHTLELPPLNTMLARRMIGRTKIAAALDGTPGMPPVDKANLEKLLVRFSELVVSHRKIKEIEVNPLLVSNGDMIALDARVVLHPPGVDGAIFAPLAIRPYPVQYVSPWKLPDGTFLRIRPIRPEDEPAMIAFHATLSQKSVGARYFAPLNCDQRVAHQRLRRICFADYARSIALVIERKYRGGNQILGVGRLGKLHNSNEARLAIVIADKWQGLGLGTHLVELLVQIAREERLTSITAWMLPDNVRMQHILRKSGFNLHLDSQEDKWIAEYRFA